MVRAHAGDERQTAGYPPRVERLAQLEHLVGPGGGAELHADGIADASQELDVSPVELARPLADPQQMRRAVVPVAGECVLSRECFLEAEDQRLVAGVEVDLVQLRL